MTIIIFIHLRCCSIYLKRTANNEMRLSIQRFPHFSNLPNFRMMFEGKDLFENLLTSLNVTRHTKKRNGIISTVICNTISYLLSDHSFYAVIIRKKETNKQRDNGRQFKCRPRKENDGAVRDLQTAMYGGFSVLSRHQLKKERSL